MTQVRSGVAVATLMALSAAGIAAAAPATAAEAAAPQDALVINEASSSSADDVMGGADWIEIHNTADVPVDASGVLFADSEADHVYAIPADTEIAAGGYLILTEYDAEDFPAGHFDFGLGNGDSARLFAPDTVTTGGDGALVLDASAVPFDATTWAGHHAAPSWGRCPDATGDFAILDTPTPGATNICPEPPAPAEAFRINETQSTGETADFIEVVNTASVAVNFDGVVVMDDKDEEAWVATGIGEVPAGGYVHLESDVHFSFGLGKGDSARLFAPGTALTADGGLVEDVQPFDSTTWPADQHTAPTWGRCPDGTGDFTMTGAATPGAANDCSGDYEPPVEEPAELSGDLAINEVESNGDDTDWVEVMNLTDAPIDISGWAIKDNDDGRTDVVPDGSVVPAGGVLVIDQETATYPQGFTFGLGVGDTFRLYDLEGQLQATYTWTSHALVSWARCPNGTGEWRDATASTKGSPNECSTPLRLNEIESSDAGDGPDWVEVMNIGATAVDASGLIVKDDDDEHVYEVPAGTTIDAGGLLLIDDLGFGLGGGDTARLFAADGETVIDSYGWDSHAATTYGRCPDGSGEFATTVSPTPGELNDCAGLVRASAWPGGADVTVVDGEDWFSGDMSGIDYDAATGDLWAVQNGDGLLYRLTADAAGTWTIAPGWEAGRVLRYPGGTGTVDAEGVTVREGEPGVVYVSSERDNDQGSTSRPSVLRFETAGTGELVATDEWNLSQLAPLSSLPANGGLEGITWIPDVGAFAVGVEGTASVYLVSLEEGGVATLLDTLSTESLSFPLVADVQWDTERDLLWVVCDEACDGRIATFAQTDDSWEITALYERPAGMANVANEGFAIGGGALCVDGAVPTFYVDDADTGGFSLRSGTLTSDCEDSSPGGGDGDGSGPGDGDGDGSGSGGGGETAEPLCEMTAPASASAGEPVTVRVDPECAPSEVLVVMYSEPTVIGTAAVAADGSITFTIPADLPAGDHTIELQAADGTVIGSTGITVTEAGDVVLADTGASDWEWLLLAAALLASVGGMILVARRTIA